MAEMIYLVVGLMIVMAVIPVLAVVSLTLAISKRYFMRFNDAVDRQRFRVRLGGNVAYFVASLNALAVGYYFVNAGLPLGARFDPWIATAAQTLPAGWYMATAFAFLIAGFLMKVTRSVIIAAFLLVLFAAQIVMELWPTLFALSQDPGLFTRFFEEIARLREAYANVGGIPGTVMSTVLAGMVYGAVLQITYYALAITGFLIALRATLRLRQFSSQKFRTPDP
jgi:hypothetical protein